MSGQRQGSGQDGAEMDIIYIAAGVIVIFGIFLYFFHVQLVNVIFFIKYYELRLIGFFLPQYHTLADWISNTPTEQVSLLAVLDVSRMAGEVMRYPMVLISVVLAALIFFLHSDNRYCAIESMDSLSDKMRTQFSASQVVN